MYTKSGGDGREAPLSPVLHEKNVSTLTLSECRSRWRNSLTQPRVTWQHICVDDEEGKVSACQVRIFNFGNIISFQILVH